MRRRGPPRGSRDVLLVWADDNGTRNSGHRPFAWSTDHRPTGLGDDPAPGSGLWELALHRQLSGLRGSRRAG
jgi:hypothetical protein